MPFTRSPERKSSNRAKGENTDKATAELSAVVDELLNQLSTKFSTISSELLSKSAHDFVPFSLNLSFILASPFSSSIFTRSLPRGSMIPESSFASC